MTGALPILPFMAKPEVFAQAAGVLGERGLQALEFRNAGKLIMLVIGGVPVPTFNQANP